MINTLIFTFSCPCAIEKELLWSQIFKNQFSPVLHVLGSSESEKHIFNGWSVCGSFFKTNNFKFIDIKKWFIEIANVDAQIKIYA